MAVLRAFKISKTSVQECSRRFLSSLQVSQNQENIPSKLIRFDVSAKIEGEESQIVTVKLQPGETLRAEAGAMLFMTQGVEMATSLRGASSAFQRMMTGQNVFLTDFTYNGNNGGEGTVGLGTDFPSKIIRLTLEDYGGSLIAQRGAYLASNSTVDIQMEFTKTLSQGFFGGQGFILQRLSGEGDVLVKAGGALVEKELVGGEVLRVTSGSIVAFEQTASYDIQMIPGIKNVMFGGEGLFVTTLIGPGKIWLQGMPQDRLIGSIVSRVPGGAGFGPVVPLGGGSTNSESDDGESEGQVGDSEATGMVRDVGADSAEEKVASTDEEVIADRQATVASSGVMMGDDDSMSDSTITNDSHSTSTSDGPDRHSERTFKDDDASFSVDSEPTFVDDTSFSTENDQELGELAQENNSTDDNNFETEIFDTGPTDAATEDGSSTISNIFSTIWDMFTGGDD